MTIPDRALAQNSDYEALCRHRRAGLNHPNQHRNIKEHNDMNTYANTVEAIQNWLADDDNGPLVLVGPSRSGKTSAVREALDGLGNVAWTSPGVLASHDGLTETIGEGRDVIVIEGGHFNERATSALSAFADPRKVPFGQWGQHLVRFGFPTIIITNEPPTFEGPWADEVKALINVLEVDAVHGHFD